MPPRTVNVVRKVARPSVPVREEPELESDNDMAVDVRRPVQAQHAPNQLRPIGVADAGALWPMMDTPPRMVQAVPNKLVNVEQATCQPCQAMATNAEEWQMELHKYGFRMSVKLHEKQRENVSQVTLIILPIEKLNSVAYCSYYSCSC